MNRRATRNINTKFVSGGVYDANAKKIEQFTNPTNPSLANAADAATTQPTNPLLAATKTTPSKPVIVPQVVEEQTAVVEPKSEPVLDIIMDKEERKAQVKRLYGNIRKKPSVRARERRIRQNRRLRKSLLPKNALMSLHEMKGVDISDFTITSNTGGGFNCSVIVNQMQYEAFSQSKGGAKNYCCEKAIRDLMLQKMMSLRSLKQLEKEKDITTEQKTDDESMDVEIAENENEEDDLPMLNLASYALYKLFSQWESEGFDVPDIINVSSNVSDSQSITTPSENGDQKQQKPGPGRTTLPENWNTLHPATLLCLMRPGTTYELVETSGQPPNLIQRIHVAVDDQDYYGVGRSKKSARRDAAVNACNTLFKTDFANEVLTTA